MAVEVKMPTALTPGRGVKGQFSSAQHAFDTAAKDVLKKYALLDKERNGADFLARLFSKSNFGYGRETERKPQGGEAETNIHTGIVGPTNGDMDVDDSRLSYSFQFAPIV